MRGPWCRACVRTTRHPYTTTYRPVSTRRSSPSRAIAFLVLPRSLPTLSSWRVCTGLRPSGYSWSRATIRRRLAALRAWRYGQVAVHRRPGQSVLLHQRLDGHPGRPFTPQLSRLDRGESALAWRCAACIGRRSCCRIGYAALFSGRRRNSCPCLHGRSCLRIGYRRFSRDRNTKRLLCLCYSSGIRSRYRGY